MYLSSILALLCTLLCLHFSFISCEMIVSDDFGNAIGLPLTGGNATGGYSIMNAAIPTSPYLLTIYINDVINNGYTEPEQSQFYCDPDFYQATLISSSYESITSGGAPSGIIVKGPTPSYYLGNMSAPNVNKGLYVFNFSIPVGQVLVFRMTYLSLANPVVTDRILISIDNPNLGYPITPPPQVPEIVGDPQFVGFRGQSYQIHGVDGAIYNLISEPNTQVNSRFVFLSSGQCPVIDGIPDSNCWSHAGSYLGEISFQSIINGVLHSALIVAGTHTQGFALVQYNKKSMMLGDHIYINDQFSLSYNTTHSLTITTAHYTFLLSNSDLFINQAVRVKVPLSVLAATKAHGLLGQTYSTKVYSHSTVKYIEGTVDDYVVMNDDIYGSEFIYNQFISSYRESPFIR